MIRATISTLAVLLACVAAYAGNGVFYGTSGGGASGLTNPLNADMDTAVYDIICDGSDVANDTRLVCSADDNPTWQVNASDVFALTDGVVDIIGEIELNTNAQTACTSGVRGRLSFVAGGAGVADTVELCVKDAADLYSYANLIAAAGGLTNPLTVALDYDGNDATTDADGNSRWEHGTDDAVALYLNAAEEFTFNATSFDLQGNTLVCSPDAGTTIITSTNGVIKLDEAGTSVNSPALALAGDSSGTEIEGEILVVQAADPYIRFRVDDDNTTPALGVGLSVYDTAAELESGDDLRWASSTVIDDNSTDGDLRISKADGTTDALLRVDADNRLSVRRQGGQGAPLIFPPIAAGTEAKPTCDASAVGTVWVTDLDADTVEFCRQTAVTPTYGWTDMLGGGGGFSGDLAGSDLSDSTDDQVGIAAGDYIQFETTTGPRIYGVTATNVGLVVADETDTDGFALVPVLGDRAHVANQAGSAVGVLQSGQIEAAGALGTSFDAKMDSQSGAGFVVVDAAGGYGFDNGSTAACNLNTNCDAGISYAGPARVKFTDGKSGFGTFQIGDSTAGKPTCNGSAEGSFWMENNGASQPTLIDVCVGESDGGAETYAYRSAVDLYAHIEVGGDTANSTATTLTAANGWEHLIGNGPASIWDQTNSNGFDLDLAATDQLTALTGAGGLYQIVYSISGLVASGTDDISFAVQVDDGVTPVRCGHTRRTMNGTTSGNVSGSCIIQIDDTDEVYMVADTDSDATFTVEQGNLMLRRL